MKKAFLVNLVIFYSFSVLASAKSLVKQVEHINYSQSADQCETTSSGEENQAYSPVEALKDIQAGKLTFLGRDLFPGSDQNKTCVYKSDTAYILYNNCMANKKESPATDIEVISFKGGITSFYVQNKQAGIPVSTMTRASYDMTWRISLTPTPPAGPMNIQELKKFKEKYDATDGGCFIGSTFKAQDMSSQVQCYGGVKSPEWVEAAEKLWQEPGDDWYNAKKYLRKVVEATKF